MHENKSIASRDANRPDGLSICDITTSGMYLMFFSLHSISSKALQPGSYYPDDGDDEFPRVSVSHDLMTYSDDGHWTYPLVRCGAFDYRDDCDEREDEQYLFTAAVAEPLCLKKGNQLYFSHGLGVVTPPEIVRIHDVVIDNMRFRLEDCHCANFLTLIRIFGDSLCKWNVKGDKNRKSERTIAEWVPATDELPKANRGTYLDENDATKIRFRKSGYYLLLGRIAAKLKKDFKPPDYMNIMKPGAGGTVRLELRTNGGLPLQIDPEIISFWTPSDDYSYNKRMVEYGALNDIVYAEEDSYITLNALNGACFAQHGTAPGPTVDKIPTQSLTAMRLDNMRIDRYQVSRDYNHNMAFKRALREEDGLTQAPLFTIKKAESRYGSGELQALEDIQCIIIGCISSRFDDLITLKKNKEAIVISQTCYSDGHGFGSHTLNTVVDIKSGDKICIKTQRPGDRGNITIGGHLAMLVLE